MGGTDSPEWNVGFRRSPTLWMVAVSGLLASLCSCVAATAIAFAGIGWSTGSRTVWD